MRAFRGPFLFADKAKDQKNNKLWKNRIATPCRRLLYSNILNGCGHIWASISASETDTHQNAARLNNPFFNEILGGDWFITERGRASLLPAIHQVLNGTMSAPILAQEPPPHIRTALAGKAGVVEFHPAYGRWQIDSVQAGTTAVVPILGAIMKYGSWQAGTAMIARTIEALNESPKIDRIVLSIDSGGGTVAGTREFADMIIAIDTPVDAYISDLCASAALWIASACDRVWANNGMAEIGSIGVYTTVADWNAYYKKMGLPVTDIYSNLSTEKNMEYLEAIKGNEKPLKSRLDGIAREFINHVSARRPNMDTAKSDPMKGRMYTATEALEMGMIDGIGTMADMLGLKKNKSNGSQTNNYMNLGKKIAGLFGLTAGVSAEDITAANALLANEKIGVFVVAATAAIPNAEALQSGLDAANTEMERLNTELGTATGSLTSATAARDAALADANAKGIQLGALSALFGTAASVEGFDLVATVATAVKDAQAYHGQAAGGGPEGTGANGLPSAGGASGELNPDEFDHNKRADSMGLGGK